MKYTILYITWLQDLEQTHIGVDEYIHKVYETLTDEGVDMEIEQIDENGNTTSVRIEEVDESNKEMTYNIKVNLPNSFISMKRLNKLLEEW